jgi:hypothetical protein
LLLTQVIFYEQSSPDDVREWQECLGPEAFGSKMPETPAISAADVTSTADGAGATAASDADKAGTSAPPATGGEGGDLCTTGPQPKPGLQEAMEEGTMSKDDQHRCLYVGTPWEAEVVADRRDVEEFKEASCTIGCAVGKGPC